MKELRCRLGLLVGLLLGLTWAGRASAWAQDAATDLSRTSWQLVKFQGGDGKTLTPGDKTNYTIAFEKDGVNVRIDCNRGQGTWKSAGANQIEFGPMALTRAMCPAAPLTDRIPKDWGSVRSYVLKDGHLFLSLMADGGTYEFEQMSAAGAATAQVKGTATYRERMALPSNAVFEATLEDVSQIDAKAEVVGRTRNEHPGNPPIAFVIGYDPTRIQKGHHYVVRARILVDGKLMFTTDQHYPVLTDGENKDVTLLLRHAGTDAAGVDAGSGRQATATLENTYWRLTQVGETPVMPAHHHSRPAFLILNAEAHRVGGSSGCNGLTGSYEISGNQLTFSQMASTMMACGEGMDTEKTFLRALGQVKVWKISGQQLELYDTDGKLLARLETRSAR